MKRKLHKTLAVVLLGLMGLAMPTLAQTDYTLQNSDVTIDENGYITTCSYDFLANTFGTNLTIPEILDNKEVKGIVNGSYGNNNYGNNIFRGKNIKSVQLPATIEYIGSYAFRSNQLTSVTIPSLVTEIGNYAFEANQLTSVTFNNNSNLASIGIKAFYSNQLTSLTIPNSVTEIGNSAFSSNQLTSLTISNSVTVIGSLAFESNQLKSVIIPKSVKVIGCNAFYSNQLASVSFESNSCLATIESFAFLNNSELVNIILPSSQPNFAGWINSEGKEIEGSYTVEDFESSYHAKILYTLKDGDVTIDDNGYITACNYIGGSILTIPDKLNNKTIKGIAEGNKENNYGSDIFKDRGIIEMQLPSTLEYIGPSAFSSNLLINATIPNSVTKIGGSAFQNNLLFSVGFEQNSNLTFIDSLAFCNNQLKSISIPKNVTEINWDAFADNQLETVIFEDNSSLVNIGEYAFGRNQITVLTIPNSVVKIEPSAFISNQLEIVDFEESSSLTTIGSYAFFDNTNLINITLPSDQSGFEGWINGNGEEITEPYVVDDLVTSYKVKTSYTLTCDDVTIDDNGYITLCNIESFDSELYGSGHLIIPEELCGQEVKGITDVNPGVFENKGINLVSLPLTLEHIGTWAFWDNNLASIDIPDKVNTIGSGAFGYNQLTEVSIPGSVKEIDGYAFNENQLTSVSIPNSIKILNESVFANNLLSNILIPNSVSIIRNGAFDSNEITSVNFESLSKLYHVGNDAFNHNEGITNINLPTDQDGFDGWINSDGEQEVSQISDFTQSYTAIIPYTLTCDDVVMDDDGYINSCGALLGSELIIPDMLCEQVVKGVSDATDGKGVFANNGLLSVSLPSTLQKIGRSAFAGNQLSDINIPNNVNELGDYAFSYNQIASVTWGDGIQVMGECVFNGNQITTVNGESHNGLFYARDENGEIDYTALVSYGGVSTNINFIPNSVINIGNSVFRNRGINNVVIPEGIEYIGYGAFYDNELSSISFPNSLLNIDEFAFGWNALTSVTLQEGLKNIGRQAFNNNKIEELIIPSSVTYIGPYAFYINLINNVSFANNSNLQRIEYGAFAYNYSLTFELPATNKAGCEFYFWEDDNRMVYNAGAEVSDLNTFYEAKFTPIESTIMFTLYDEFGNPLPNVAVVISPGSTLTKSAFSSLGNVVSAVSDANGVVVLTGLDPLVNYIVDVEAQGYEDVLVQLPSGENTDVELQMLTEEVYLITFVVTGGNNEVLVGAEVTINEKKYLTDDLGMVRVVNVVDGDYPYHIAKDGTGSISGSVTVSGSDVYKEISMVATGIHEEKIVSVKAFPNPANEHVTLQTKGELLESYILYNSKGAVVSNCINIATSQVTINLDNYPCGVYFIKVSSHNGATETIKLIKK